MITSWELRKGNILMYNDNIVHVGGMSYSDFDNDHDMEWLGIEKLDGTNEIYFHGQKIYTNGAFVKGIPLTPEILTDWCGFSKTNSKVFRNGHLVLSLDLDLNGGTGHTNVALINGTIIAHPYKLHHLQNLWHSLYQRELEIKIPVKA